MADAASFAESTAGLLYCDSWAADGPTVLQSWFLVDKLTVTPVQQDHHDKTLEALKHAKKAHLHAMQAQASLKNAQEAQKKAENAQRRKQEVSQPANFHATFGAGSQQSH